MKTIIRFSVHHLKQKVLLTLLVYSSHLGIGQLNCDGVTQMYGMFNNAYSGVLRNTINPINYSTGAVGAAVGGGNFNIPYTDNNSPSTSYYGSTTLSASVGTGLFYFMNRDFNRKNIFSMMAASPFTRVNIENQTNTAFNGNWFVKLAVGLDGNNYSMATPRKTSGLYYGSMRTKLIRFPASTCATSNCADNLVVDMGSIPTSPTYLANFLYNGDIAFSSTGDMYLFGSEIDSVTNRYTRSRIYRIRAADFPATPNAANVIPMEYICDILGLGTTPGIDSVSITGAAFDGSGNFYLSASDTSSTRDGSYLYRGTSIGGIGSAVTQIATFGPIASGYTLTDLASCVYPNIVVLPNSVFRLEAEKKGLQIQLVWEDKSTMEARYYLLERKIEGEDEFKQIGLIDASEIGTDGKYHFKDNNLPSEYAGCFYRIKAILLNGTYSYSNTSKISGVVNNQFKVVNPFKDNLQFEFNASRSGKLDVRLYNEAGLLVMTKIVTVTKGKNLQSITTPSNLKQGIYILKASNDVENITARLVKQ